MKIKAEHRAVVTLFVTYLLTLTSLALLHGCGPSARNKTLATTLDAVNTTRDVFLAWDDKHQDEIMDACSPPACTFEQGRARIDAYRLKRATVVKAFEITYLALSLAAINESTPLSTLLGPVEELHKVITELQSAPSLTPISP